MRSFLLTFLFLPFLSFSQEVPPPLPVDSTGELEPVQYEVQEEIDVSWAGEGLGISGVYEAAVGVRSLEAALRYFGQLGYRVTQTGYLNKAVAEALYGVPSALKGYRLQNGKSDSHGLIRLWVWEDYLGTGVGYSQPGTIGMRVAAMMTSDITWLHDVYADARAGGEHWLVTDPIRQGVLGDDKGPFSFYERAVTTREMAVYGEEFNHLFYQRFGYTIPGYGNIHLGTKLGTSEITHHDLFVRLDSLNQLDYLVTALGLEADGPPAMEGEWLEGPRTLYMLRPGETYWFQTFRSPNNICGKLRFFMPVDPRADKSALQRPGYDGITAHTFYTPRLNVLWTQVTEANLSPTPIMPNEFGERCFVFRGPEGNTWQIIEKMTAPINEAIPVFHLQMLED